MHDCCSATGDDLRPPQKRRCPACATACAPVSTRTIAHHLKEPWRWSPGGRTYYFCDDAACDVVYFADDDSVIRRSALRTRVGAKEAADDALLCHCFGVTRATARSDPAARDYVIAQTKAARCSCETSNPSGRCCLKDFPRPDLPEAGPAKPSA